MQVTESVSQMQVGRGLHDQCMRPAQLHDAQSHRDNAPPFSLPSLSLSHTHTNTRTPKYNLLDSASTPTHIHPPTHTHTPVVQQYTAHSLIGPDGYCCQVKWSAALTNLLEHRAVASVTCKVESKGWTQHRPPTPQGGAAVKSAPSTPVLRGGQHHTHLCVQYDRCKHNFRDCVATVMREECTHGDTC